MGMFGNTNMGESTKHARIKVEIVNSCDAEWKIDILKTEATPPDDLKEALKADCKGGSDSSQKRCIASELVEGEKVRPDPRRWSRRCGGYQPHRMERLIYRLTLLTLS